MREGRRATAAALAALAAAAVATFASTGRAQGVPAAPTPSAVVPELRLDGFAARDGGVLAGAGFFADAGLYARVGLVASAGVARDRGAEAGAVPAARVEGLARFHLDPQRLARRGVYVGGGVAAAVRRGAGPQWQLVALLGVEGRRRGRTAPALEVGLGGGVRVAVALRRARPARR